VKTKILKNNRIDIVLYVFSLILSLAIPLFFAYLIDEILLSNKKDILTLWFIFAIILAVLSSFMSFYFISFMIKKRSIQNHVDLSVHCFKKLLAIPIPDYFKKDKSYYLNVISNSSSSYGDIHAEIHLTLISDIIAVILILGLVFFINRYLAVLFVIFSPIVFFGTLFQAKKLALMQSDAITKQDQFLSSLKTAIDYKREINILKSNTFFENRFTGNMHTWQNFITKYKFLDTLLSEFPKMASNIFGIVYLLFGAMLIERSKMTMGTLVVGYQYLSIISIPLTSIIFTILRIKANKEHIDRIDQLNDEITRDDYFEALKTNEDGLFQAISFKLYNDDSLSHMLFHLDNLSIGKKGLYIIKGANGVGKSMILNYMINSIDSHWGEGQVSIAKDSDKIAFLSYPLFFIEGSFTDNIFARAYDPYLLEILNIDFTDKIIRTNPVNLSLGQQQKIALLRVLSMDSNYLLLDEPFSNLDVQTQQNLTQYISELKQKKTVIAVMHDPSLDSYSDAILEIKDNNILVSGH